VTLHKRQKTKVHNFFATKQYSALSLIRFSRVPYSVLLQFFYAAHHTYVFNS